MTARGEITVRDRLRRALALTGGDGVPSLPGLPIISRTVVPGYEVVSWSGFFSHRHAGGDPPPCQCGPAGRAARPRAAGATQERRHVIAPLWTPEQARDFVRGQVAY